MPPRKKAPPRPRKKAPVRPKAKKGKVSAGDKKFLAAKATLELEDIGKRRAAEKKAKRITKEKTTRATKKETRVERLKRLAKEP